eukprot:10928629-Ditylum_brightwellii.AAC.1
MAVGITPKEQPSDKLMNKIFKGYLHYEYSSYILEAPINVKTGHSKHPSYQLVTQWIVKLCGFFSQSLVKCSWEMGCFKSYETCQTDIETSMASRNESMSQNDAISTVERTAEIYAVQQYLDSKNEAEPHFDDEDKYGRLV